MKRFFALLLVVGLAAAGYWYYQTQLKFMLQPQPVEIAPQRWHIGQTNGSAANTTVLIPENATNATETNATNATMEENATSIAVVPTDSIVTHEFIRDLTQYIVARYYPAQTSRNPSAMARLDLNIKSMNVRYAMELPGMVLDKTQTLKARKILFSHVFSPKILEFMQTYYVPLFLDTIDQELSETTNTTADGKVLPISDVQRKEMLTMLAGKFRTLGLTIAALAKTDDIAPLLSKYQEDIEKVNAAHVAFWNLQDANATEVEIDEAGTKIKMAIQMREMSRQRLLQTIVSKISPQGLDAADLMYLAQWVHRRSMEQPDSMPLVAKGGELLVKTATALEERAKIPLSEALQNATNSSLQ